MLRDQVADIVIGTVFVFAGLAACAVAAMRRWSGVRVLAWTGAWSAIYGARPLVDTFSSLQILPQWIQSSVPYIRVSFEYLTLVFAALAWRELSIGKFQSVLKGMIVSAMAIAIAGISVFALTGSNRLIVGNQILATCALCILLAVVAVPKLSAKFLALRNRGILLLGTLVFAIEALYANVSRPMGYAPSYILDSLAFAALLFSFAYAAMQFIFANEKRLQSIENELAIAREIQASIIPGKSPELSGLCIAAAYRPMTYVAGDFYDFLPVDRNRAGFLVADVSGHGVPAALIASMIKIAMRSVEHCAFQPGEVLRGLNRALSGQLHNQLVTAAYLWIDTEKHTALYSAAGHPPLLLWRKGKLESIESNGLLFGVMADSEYPVRSMSVDPGDRFLLYSDGLIEPENVNGEAFGDHRLEEVLRKYQSCSPPELSDQLLLEIRLWQPGSGTQQDDITLVVVDVI